MKSSTSEGVIQFHCTLTPPPPWPDAWIDLLNQARQKAKVRGWLGQDPQRYEGLGFGNLSLRTATPEHPNAFIISASQTGHLNHLTPEYWTQVLNCNLAQAQVNAAGIHPPSSEALTHAALYQANPDTQAVLHLHCPQGWRKAQQTAWPATPCEATNGSQALAFALTELGQTSPQRAVMLGHTDGLLAWGHDFDQIFNQLLRDLV